MKKVDHRSGCCGWDSQCRFVSAQTGNVEACLRGSQTIPTTSGQKICRALAQRTGNKVDQIDVFPSTQLGNERDMVEGLQLGTIDLVVTSTGPLGGFVLQDLYRRLAFSFPGSRARRGSRWPHWEKLLNAFEGIKGLAFWENGFRQITNNVRPIEKPEDLKGIKLRTMENKVHLAALRAGASPTPMAWSEVYTALQQKTIDGQENPIAIIYHQKLCRGPEIPCPDRPLLLSALPF